MEDENASRYKDRPKNPRRGVQTAPIHEKTIGVQRPIWHFWSAEAEFSLVGLWPNSLRVKIMHTLFDFSQKDAFEFKP